MERLAPISGAPLEDEAPVEQRLEPVREELAVREVLESVRVLGERREAGVQLHGD